jgi:HTH-type transcriptional regulator/antitoxin HigA
MTALLDDETYGQALADYLPRPIHDDAENERATAMLEEIGSLADPTPEQIAIAEILITLIEAYEKKYALERPSGLAVLRELMLANDMKQRDLEAIIKSKGLVSDLLREKRAISKGVAQKLATRFSVDYRLFL